jgi:hypothetical protein
LSVTWKLGLGDDIVVDADRVLAMTSNVHPRPDQFRQQGHTDISISSSAETDTTTTGDIRKASQVPILRCGNHGQPRHCRWAVTVGSSRVLCVQTPKRHHTHNGDSAAGARIRAGSGDGRAEGRGQKVEGRGRRVEGGRELARM